tara:strand:- start:170 stop:616 length:447 start_codon:yes stop_codon:yes gene_type:complete
MKNKLDQYSIPKDITEHNLATVYTLNHGPSRNGRLWMPVFDNRFPLEFNVEFAYLSRFFEKDNASGNHYHRIKKEILIPLEGRFDFYLECIETGKKEAHAFSSADHKAVYIRTGISHRIASRGETGTLLVLASTPSDLEDEIRYEVSE